MSEAAATVTDVARPVSDALSPVQRRIEKATGLSPELSRGLTLGGTVGSLFPSGAIPAFQSGVEIEGQIKQAREQAALDEQARQQFNDEIFRLAQKITGEQARAPFFDPGGLQFQGDDPRQVMLDALVKDIGSRGTSLQQQLFSPGLSQTRLSLVQ